VLDGVVVEFIFADFVVSVSVHIIKCSHRHIVDLLIVWLFFTLFLGVKLGNLFKHAFDLFVTPNAIVVTVNLSKDLICEDFDLGLIV